MNEAEAARILVNRGAILKGSFILSSGKISDTYVQLFKLLDYPDDLRALCRALAERIAQHPVDVLLAPAMGAVIPGYVVSEELRSLGVHHRYMFCERVGLTFELRRGFSISQGERVWILENLVTTGKTAREAMEIVTGRSAVVAGVAAMVDRGGGASLIAPGCAFVSLIRVTASEYEPDEAPKDLVEMGPIKPGSRP